MRTRYLAFVLLAACGGSKENKQICQKASTRYLQCVGEILGPEGRALAARTGENIDACAKDDKTVAMYRKCLPSATCSQFMDCMTDYAEATVPAIEAGSRKTMCAQHVEDGMRSIANGIMMVDEIDERDDAAKRTAQECLFDESRPWKTCLTAPEVLHAERYATKRQADCEAWEPELAACILKQPGATNCNEDEYPLWELPVERGAEGPAVAWTSTVTDHDDHDDVEVQLAWTANKTLIVRDDTGLRALRDGKQIWQTPLGDSVRDELVLAGNWIVVRHRGDVEYLQIIDATTGKPYGRALVDVPLEHHGPAGDKVMVQLDDDQLVEIDPAKCRGDKPGKACATRLGQLDTNDTVYTTQIALIGGLVVMTDGSSIHVADRKAGTRHALSFDDAYDVVPTEDGAAVVSDGRVELLSFAGCARGDECVTAHLNGGWIGSIDPIALPGGGIAFNDDGIVEKTGVLERDGSSWAVKTNARAGIAGDREYIYTVSFGRSEKEPTHIMALSRKTGKTVWSTELTGAWFDATQAAVAVRDAMLAVRVGDKLYAFNLAKKA